MDESRAREVLGSAGLDAGAELMVLGENAVFASGDLVIKVGRAPELLDRAQLALRIADWLKESDVPAVRAARSEPLLVEGHPVTLWERLPEASRPATPADLATLLRRVHALPAPSFALPRRELLGGVERWLRLAGDAIDPADADFLRARRDGFAPAAAALTPHLTPGPVHGDALPRNVLAGPDGPVLSDLETFSFDLREHDLVVMDLSRDRYGLPTEAYEEFVRAYGWDVREWEGRLTLRGARETASCAWVAQHAPSNPAALTEFRRRVNSLRDGDTTVRWYPF
ncbi:MULTISPECIES: phosphotransferase enzyme family protein [unclassified Streptomyces]|uniref:Aminoglycoside phosphotransferase family protein n=2 Tax=Streptomyces TaxID=1883 RepID=A0ABD5DZN8_9ACTN|nr:MULTISPECIES: aminoglycoside phosphotransferase family protein [unclassified Streptomyces]EGJ73984.1 putative phosphotransferase enzyme family protein [Streptomyces sp. Tu6071]MDT0412162.1 aminoglycoside phosphotransferase family protein [Streptomyces sp. DSM 41979]MDT0414636.1 aminoglycoside phosphotransferase family protein [Streptomyces sp. DSM 41982]MYQ56024.1 phosphotransferase [Streptomyces sp. SID4926]WEH30509.1 aminoglycoside phosphotransferase family protein [Streptomyces sp. AM 3-